MRRYSSATVRWSTTQLAWAISQACCSSCPRRAIAASPRWRASMEIRRVALVCCVGHETGLGDHAVRGKPPRFQMHDQVGSLEVLDERRHRRRFAAAARECVRHRCAHGADAGPDGVGVHRRETHRRQRGSSERDDDGISLRHGPTVAPVCDAADTAVRTSRLAADFCVFVARTSSACCDRTDSGRSRGGRTGEPRARAAGRVVVDAGPVSV